MNQAVKKWVSNTDTEFYRAGFRLWGERWDKCVQLNGDDVEKQTIGATSVEQMQLSKKRNSHFVDNFPLSKSIIYLFTLSLKLTQIQYIFRYLLNAPRKYWFI